MKSLKFFLVTGTLVSCLTTNINAQQTMNTNDQHRMQTGQELSARQQAIVTISALAGLGGAENQLRSHFGVGMYNGLTAGQLHHLVSIIQSNVGAKEGNAASQVLQTVLKQRQDNKAPEKQP